MNTVVHSDCRFTPLILKPAKNSSRRQLYSVTLITTYLDRLRTSLHIVGWLFHQINYNLPSKPMNIVVHSDCRFTTLILKPAKNSPWRQLYPVTLIITYLDRLRASLHIDGRLFHPTSNLDKNRTWDTLDDDLFRKANLGDYYWEHTKEHNEAIGECLLCFHFTCSNCLDSFDLYGWSLGQNIWPPVEVIFFLNRYIRSRNYKLVSARKKYQIFVKSSVLTFGRLRLED